MPSQDHVRKTDPGPVATPPASAPGGGETAPPALPHRRRCPLCHGPLKRYDGANPFKQGTWECDACGIRVAAEDAGAD